MCSVFLYCASRTSTGLSEHKDPCDYCFSALGREGGGGTIQGPSGDGFAHGVHALQSFLCCIHTLVFTVFHKLLDFWVESAWF